MFKGEFEFNLKDALTTYPNQYSDTYASTNEPIEQWPNLTPVTHAPRVLTVAASGDQPLMYAANGAAHVDTFDITVYACAAMDFKTTALQQMTYSDYINEVHILKHFYDIEASKTYGLISDYNATKNVINNMPMRTRQLMQAAIHTRRPAFGRDYLNTNVFPPDEHTYAKMQQAVKSPFNFIWTDLINLTHYIDDKYDIINISNIFDHYISALQNKPAGAIFDTIQNLLQHTNRGGYILFTTFSTYIPHILHQNRKTLDSMPIKTAVLPSTEYDTPSIIVIQKTR